MTAKARMFAFADSGCSSFLSHIPDPPVCHSLGQAVALFGVEGPIDVIYPALLERAARRFVNDFPGRILYAVKANPHPAVLRQLHAAGISDFDVASSAEIDLVRACLPEGRLHFMHPVKSRAAIRHALLNGVRHFAFDCAAELAKIREEAGALALDLTLRIALPPTGAALELTGKFGAAAEEAIALLRQARPFARRLGIAFHVGSQCEHPEAFAKAIAHAAGLVHRAGVAIDRLDVGGGFPVPYPDRRPPALAHYFRTIRRAMRQCGLKEVELLCEPGRALVAEAGSVLLRVDLRKDDALYLNDGSFGALHDAAALGWRYPARRIWRAGRGAVTEDPTPLRPFRLFGPTCDSMDRMDGPFFLPADMAEGDWIEVGHLGAYGAAMRTAFNGFGKGRTVLLRPRDRQPSAAIARHSRPRCQTGDARPFDCAAVAAR